MADAESLARRLTAAETQLRQVRGTPPAAARGPDQPVTSTPADGPVELQAKADLLLDQARRLWVEADSLSRAATRVRSRQLMKRRAGVLESDPFAALDVSKRNMVFGAPRTGAQGDATKGGSVPMADSAARGTPGGASL